MAHAARRVRIACHTNDFEDYMTARRLSTTPPFSCVTCEIEIAGPVTFHLGLPFCCAGCAAGGPCTCSYDFEPRDAQIRHCLDVRGAVGSDAFVEREAAAAIRP